MDAKLIVIGGKANKSEVKLKLPTTIGRSRKADLTVAHPKVSRQHCEIFERDGVLMVRDFGSLNGTYIGDARVSEAILRPGDKLTVGPLTFVAVYQHSGPLPAAPLNPADLPTPALNPAAMPEATIKATAPATVRTKARPAPQPIEPIPPVAAPAAEASPLDLETSQPPTIGESAAEPAADVDDFSWLTGETVAAPEPAAGPQAPSAAEPPSPAYAETVNLKWEPEDDAEPKAEGLPLPDAMPAPAELELEEGAPSNALQEQPPADSQDFSWLQNAKDEPADFSAFETADVDSQFQETQPAEPPMTSAADEDLGRTVVQEPAPTMAIPKPAVDAALELPPPATPPAQADDFDWLEKPAEAVTNVDVALPPAAFAPAPVDAETAMFEPDAPAAHDLSPETQPASTDAPPTEPAASEEPLPDFTALAQETSQPAATEDAGFPDFAAIARSSDDAEQNVGFPPIVMDQPSASAAPAPVVSAPAAASKTAKKPAAKKGWWPFSSKKKDASKVAAAPADEHARADEPADEAPAEEPIVEEAVGQEDDVSSQPGVTIGVPPESPEPSAPPFVFAPPEEAKEAAEAPANDDDDPALGQFFKSLK